MAQGETDSGRPIGVGIVGCGIIARTHIRALLAFPHEASVTALASRSQESIAGAAAYLREQAEEHAADAEAGGDRALAEQYREIGLIEPTRHADWQALVADPAVDAVVVTTPPFLHHPVTVAALRAGKHVLCEKPLAVSLREADEMIDAARTARRVLSTVSQGRFAEAQRRMHALVHTGALGRVFFGKADGQWYRPPTLLRALVARHLGARGRRRRDRSGHSHPGSDALDSGETARPGDRQDRHVRAPGP